MQRAMTEVFSNEHGPDKVVVVLDATAANSLQAARNVNLFKHISEVLRKVNMHHRIAYWPRRILDKECLYWSSCFPYNRTRGVNSTMHIAWERKYIF